MYETETEKLLYNNILEINSNPNYIYYKSRIFVFLSLQQHFLFVLARRRRFMKFEDHNCAITCYIRRLLLKISFLCVGQWCMISLLNG